MFLVSPQVPCWPLRCSQTFSVCGEDIEAVLMHQLSQLNSQHKKSWSNKPFFLNFRNSDLTFGESWIPLQNSKQFSSPRKSSWPEENALQSFGSFGRTLNFKSWSQRLRISFTTQLQTSALKSDLELNCYSLPFRNKLVTLMSAG